MICHLVAQQRQHRLEQRGGAPARPVLPARQLVAQRHEQPLGVGAHQQPRADARRHTPERRRQAPVGAVGTEHCLLLLLPSLLLLLFLLLVIVLLARRFLTRREQRLWVVQRQLGDLLLVLLLIQCAHRVQQPRRLGRDGRAAVGEAGEQEWQQAALVVGPLAQRQQPVADDAHELEADLRFGGFGAGAGSASVEELRS